MSELFTAVHKVRDVYMWPTGHVLCVRLSVLLSVCVRCEDDKLTCRNFSKLGRRNFFNFRIVRFRNHKHTKLAIRQKQMCPSKWSHTWLPLDFSRDIREVPFDRDGSCKSLFWPHRYDGLGWTRTSGTIWLVVESTFYSVNHDILPSTTRGDLVISSAVMNFSARSLAVAGLKLKAWNQLPSHIRRCSRLAPSKLL